MVVTTQDKTSDQLFHVYLRDGRTFAVSAATFARRVELTDDVIKFIDADGAEKGDVFLRAPDTSAIAPDSSAVVPAPMAALQDAVAFLEARVDKLENSLIDMIAGAVRGAVADAFADRGM